MKSSLLFSLICLLFLIFNPSILNAQVKYSRVSIHILQPDIKELQKMGLQFDHGEYNKEKQQLTTTLSTDDILLLKKSSFSFKILIDDEIDNFKKLNIGKNFYESETQQSRLPFGDGNCEPIANSIITPVDFTEGSMGGYYTLAEINAKIDLMISKYPGLVRKDTIGYSFEKRPLIVVKISDNVNSDENEPELFLHSLEHAREPQGMMQLMFFMQYLLEQYNKSTSVKEIVNSREMYFMPCFNPDGYEYNRSTNPTGGGLHRKNRNNTNGATSNIGTDLNRNYSIDWGYDNIGSSPISSSDTYRGPTAFSEPELQAIRKFVNSRKFILHVDYHTYSNVFIYPYGVPQNHSPQPLDEQKFYNYSKTVLPRHNFFGVGTAPETVGYSVNGVSSDWYVVGDTSKRSKVYSYAAEIGTSTDGFWPQKNRIITLAKEQLWHNFQLAYMAGSYPDYQDASPVSIANKTGNFSNIVMQTGLTPVSIKVSIIPIKNIASVGNTITIPAGAYLQSKIINISYNLSSTIKAGETVKFVWKFTSGGINFYDTITKIYRPTVLLIDDMEGNFSTNWVTNGQWNFNTKYAFAGTRSLHDASGLNYLDKANNIVTCNKIFDLGDASSAYLSFYTIYKSESGYDKLTAEISTTGTTGPFSPICGNETVTESFGNLGLKPAYTGNRANWTREIIDLSPYKGKTNVVLRFRMTSDVGVTDEGFYIDNIEVVKTSIPSQQKSNSISTNSQYLYEKFHVYPNPVSNVLFATWNASKSGEVVFKIFDNSGIVIYTLKQNVLVGNNKISIPLNHLKSGVYSIVGVNGDHLIESTFLKE